MTTRFRPDGSIVVGYVANARGNDALELAGFLANGTESEIVVVMVLPETRAGNEESQAELDRWKNVALKRLPKERIVSVEFRYASSEARGLIDAAEQHDAAQIVIGAAAGRLMRKFSVGSTANALLHSSPVPVALAPRGFRAPDGRAARITGIYGTRPGSEAVIGRTVQRAIDRDIPLRLISLVQVDLIRPSEIREVADEAREFGGRHLEAQAVGMLDSGRAVIEIAEGKDFEDALAQVDWLEDEFALLGSSRLGGGRSVFLGSRAHRILRTLPVPVVVIPSDLRGPEAYEAPAAAL
ncbi:universal stress protein [Gulosibacter molinativorax]|uniref:universal stress protein n=1 Tax=Gulosibacter molinativorax TaxID=256821 RepID=UPI00146E7AD6|nr:universal stress protein [Gulosibacter molinativorax]QUY62566.1 Universal stress protein G [Gulosibacter molinativorax]